MNLAYIPPLLLSIATLLHTAAGMFQAVREIARPLVRLAPTRTRSMRVPTAHTNTPLHPYNEEHAKALAMLSHAAYLQNAGENEPSSSKDREQLVKAL
jgi:hypothetical protein